MLPELTGSLGEKRPMQAPAGHLKKPQFKQHPSSLCTEESCFSFTPALLNLYFIPSVRKQPLYPFPPLSLHLEGMFSIPFRQLVRETGNRKPWHWRADSVRICDKQDSLSDEVSTSQTLKCSNCLSATYWSYNTEDCQL